MSVAQALAPVPGAPAGEHVFAGGRIDHHVGRIAAVVDPAFLAEAGWDPARQILVFAPEHPLLGRRICRAQGCATTATAASGICGSCRKRLIENGLDEPEVAALPPRERRSQRRGPECCRVPGCAREWLSLRSGLCSAHAEQKRRVVICSVGNASCNAGDVVDTGFVGDIYVSMFWRQYFCFGKCRKANFVLRQIFKMPVG